VRSPAARAERRARLLLRLYPAHWRARYGEEFAQLLIDDITERPHSLRRTVDVLRAGLLARMSGLGLAGETRSPLAQMRSSLGVLWSMLAAFLVFAVAMWSQLTIGWQWSAPASHATAAAMVVMSCAILAIGVLVVLAAAPLAWSACRAAAGHDGGVLRGALLMVLVGVLVIVFGSLHFGHGWPGTGGHAWSGRGLVPARVGSLAWAATLWVTSYWAHPAALAAFPASEIAWMLVSPLALALVLAGAARIVRELALSPRTLRYETWLAAGVGFAMAAFVTGALMWVVSGGPAPRELFRIGAIDAVGVVLMGATVLVAVQAIHRALTAAPAPKPSG
jgi:hypothetical protein